MDMQGGLRGPLEPQQKNSGFRFWVRLNTPGDGTICLDDFFVAYSGEGLTSLQIIELRQGNTVFTEVALSAHDTFQLLKEFCNCELTLLRFSWYSEFLIKDT